jgi:hypothetical protein
MYVQPTIERLGDRPMNETGGALLLTLGPAPTATASMESALAMPAAAWVAC